MESSQEVWYVPALVSTPYTEGGGGSVIFQSIHSAVDFVRGLVKCSCIILGLFCSGFFNN